MRGNVIVIAATLASAVGCATPRASTTESYTPQIAISPGVAGRLALMDRYRLHDEDRKHMMEKPRVWVEEAVEGAEAPNEGSDDTDEPDAASAPPVADSAKSSP